MVSKNNKRNFDLALEALVHGAVICLWMIDYYFCRFLTFLNGSFFDSIVSLVVSTEGSSSPIIR